MDLALLETTLAELGQPAFRSRQVWEWTARGAAGGGRPRGGGTGHAVMDLLLDLCAQEQVGLVLVTHNIEEAVLMADRVLIFAADGTFVQALKKVAGMALSRPMAIATTPDGGVWIADAGNRRIASSVTAAFTPRPPTTSPTRGRVSARSKGCP